MILLINPYYLRIVTVRGIVCFGEHPRFPLILPNNQIRTRQLRHRRSMYITPSSLSYDTCIHIGSEAKLPFRDQPCERSLYLPSLNLKSPLRTTFSLDNPMPSSQRQFSAHFVQTSLKTGSFRTISYLLARCLSAQDTFVSKVFGQPRLLGSRGPPIFSLSSFLSRVQASRLCNHNVVRLAVVECYGAKVAALTAGLLQGQRLLNSHLKRHMAISF